MPYINIHWKGHPQHHLPKIRLASTPSVSVRNRSTAAAQQVAKLPLGPGLEQERKKNRFNFRVRRRRGRSSRTSVVAQAKRRASQRARQNRQVFGWDTPNADLASKATTELYFGSRQSTPRPPRVPPPTGHLQNETESVIPSTDGAGSSLVRQTFKPKKSESRYSLMHVAELPTKPHSRKKFSFESDQLSAGSTRRAGREYAHSISRDRAYDTRIDPKTRAGIRRRTIIPRDRPLLPEGSSFKTSTKRKKPQSLAVNSIASRSKEGRSDSSIKSIVQSVFSGISRTRSQRKALRRFTKEIELYLQAARTLPKQSLVPSITATSISANTILELKPYRSQFQSAGLAVTSQEQRGETPLREVPIPPPTPPKDKKWENMAILSRRSKNDLKSGKKEEKGKAPERGPPSFASGSTGTTVLGFTPPHEKSYPRPRMDRKQPSIESDHTILGFTPPHEKMITPPPPLPTFQELRPTTKRSLPWLRRASQSPEASPTEKMSVVPVEKEQQPRLSTPLQGWVSTFDMTDKPTPSAEERGVGLPENRPEATSRHSSATKWRESRGGMRRITPMSTKEETKIPEQFSSTAVKPAGGGSKPCQHVNYVDTAVQADVLDDEELESDGITAQAEPPLIERAPIPTGRNKTFPIPPNRCKGDCKHAAGGSIAESPQKKSERPSRVTWQGVESSTQTEVTNAPVNEPQKATDTVGRKLSFPSDVQPAERSGTFLLTSRNTRSSRLVQQAPRLKSPQKSLDESKGKPTSQGKAFEPSTPPSRRPPSPPPICSQCAQPIDPASEDPRPESTYACDHDADVTPKPGRPARACTSRSSMLCQQCFPSRQVSLEMSPLQASSPVEVSYHSSARRSTRPIIPTGPVTYPEEASVSLEQQASQVTQCLASAEGQEMHRAIIKEAIQEFSKQIPIADPVKRPSITAPKFQPTPRPQPSSIRLQPSSGASRVKVLPSLAQRPLIITTACPLDHVASSSTSLDTILPKSSEITDKQVFRGLHVATAAACDEDVDKWIEEITGTGVRKFLADLSAFEGLGVNTLANVASRAAKQRKEQLKAWEEVRERRLATHSREVQFDPTQYRVQDEDDGRLKAGEFFIGDQGVEWKGGEEPEAEQGDELMMDDQGVGVRQKRDGLGERMLHRREVKGSEGARERAVKMGWRERSVSG